MKRRRFSNSLSFVAHIPHSQASSEARAATQGKSKPSRARKARSAAKRCVAPPDNKVTTSGVQRPAPLTPAIMCGALVDYESDTGEALDTGLLSTVPVPGDTSHSTSGCNARPAKVEPKPAGPTRDPSAHSVNTSKCPAPTDTCSCVWRHPNRWLQ